MSDAAIKAHAHHDEHGEDGHHDTGSLKVFGFWIYLMTDLVLFATLFAVFAVLRGNIANGPSASQIFDLKYVLVETFALLLSSVTFGFAMLALYKGDVAKVRSWLLVTFVFGLIFVGMEINEFHHLIQEGYTPESSGFLSSFFTLVSTHGLHVTAGLIWMATMIFQLSKKGITPENKTRMMCLSLFWHFLDIVWICVFSVVYLIGVMK